MAARVLALVGIASGFAAPAAALDYPTRTVRIVVPFPPGGATDLLARRLAERMAQGWGQPVIVENRAGAGGMMAATSVARSPADGYTLLVSVPGATVINPLLTPQPGFDPQRDLQPVSLLVTSPLVIAANPGKSFKTLAEAMQKARDTPSSVSYGSSGTGTSLHLTGELLARAAGVQLLHVPYKGNAASVQDALGGQIDMVLSDVPVVLPHIASGKLLALAVTSKTRHPLLPQVPTVQEAGYPGFETVVWNGLFAPAGVPAEVVDKVRAAAVEGMQNPALKEFLATQGLVVSGSSPAEFRSFLATESAKWSKVIKDGNIKAE